MCRKQTKQGAKAQQCSRVYWVFEFITIKDFLYITQQYWTLSVNGVLWKQERDIFYTEVGEMGGFDMLY